MTVNITRHHLKSPSQFAPKWWHCSEKICAPFTDIKATVNCVHHTKLRIWRLGLKHFPETTEQNSEYGGDCRPKIRLGTFHTLLLRLLEREDEETTFFEMAVTVYGSTRRYIPKDSNVQQYRCEELRSRNVKFSS